MFCGLFGFGFREQKLLIWIVFWYMGRTPLCLLPQQWHRNPLPELRPSGTAALRPGMFLSMRGDTPRLIKRVCRRRPPHARRCCHRPRVLRHRRPPRREYPKEFGPQIVWRESRVLLGENLLKIIYIWCYGQNLKKL